MNNLLLLKILIDSFILPMLLVGDLDFKCTPFLHYALLPAHGDFHLLVEQNQYSVIRCHLDVTLCKQWSKKNLRQELCCLPNRQQRGTRSGLLPKSFLF